MSLSKPEIWPNGPVLENGEIRAMPDGVAAPKSDFDPQKLLGNPVENWSLRSVTADQALSLFNYIQDKQVFISCTEAKMIRPEGNYAVFEYNIYPSDPLKRYGPEKVFKETKEAFLEIARIADENEDYPVIYDIWLDKIG